MSPPPFDLAAAKRPASLSLDSDLARRARQLGIDLYSELEARLAELSREHEAREWRQRNRRAIADYNDRIARSSAFSDGRRRF